MRPDKKVLYIVTLLAAAALLFSFFLPGEYSGRMTAALLLIPISLAAFFFIKKRTVLSMYKKQILLLMSVIAVLCLVLLYVTGLFFGFVRNPYASGQTVLTHLLPSAVIIMASEIFRYVIRAQGDRKADVLSYVACVIAEALLFGNIYYIVSFNKFMDFLGSTLFPALIANLLYHYLTARYGFLPIAVYRLILGLYIYLIPYTPALSDALLAFARLLIPIVIYVFIDALYEKKRQYALKKKSKLAIPASALAAVAALSLMMLISNHFRFGMLVIATPSMTGELNKGDAVITERYDGEHIAEGEIIAFEKDGSVIVHRVVDIQQINGVTHYYTKGDANEDNDVGFVLKEDIVGLVRGKIAYAGYPTLWLRSLFTH